MREGLEPEPLATPPRTLGEPPPLLAFFDLVGVEGLRCTGDMARGGAAFRGSMLLLLTCNSSREE
jgi:hypothetical protein